MWPFGNKRDRSKDTGAILKVQGGNQDAVLYKDRVIIRRWKGRRKLHYEKSIRLASINAVQLREPGRAGVGYLQFVVTGESPPVGRGRLQTLADENTVVFSKKQYRDFQTFREHVERAMFDDR